MASENSSRKIRFVAVGAINTALDFGIFFALSAAGLWPVIANYVSTTVALSFSFVANKKYTFRASQSRVHREILLFLFFTLIGLWIWQPVIIFAIHKIIDGTSLEYWLSLAIPKLIATLASMVWNYYTYSRYVFHKPSSPIAPTDEG